MTDKVETNQTKTEIGDTRLKKNRYATLFFLVLIVSFIFLAIHLSKSYKDRIFEFLDNAHLIPTKEAFTELYFVMYPTLQPSEVVVGKKIDFSFEIHNVEGKDVNYSYKVYFKSPNKNTDLIRSGNIFINNGGKATQLGSYTLKKGQSGNVVVYLNGLNRYIYFSIPDKNLIPDSTFTATSSLKEGATATNE